MIWNNFGFRFFSRFMIFMVCFDVSTQRQISQGYPQSAYSSVGHGGTLNGQLSDVQKHILDNGGKTLTHDGRRENIQPLRAGGEDPLRLRLVFMAEVSNSGKNNSSVNQTTKSDRSTRQEVNYLASHPSSMNLSVSNQFSPHGDIVHLGSHGILVAQKRKNQSPIPHRTSASDSGRMPAYMNTRSEVPQAPRTRTAEARRYKDKAPTRRPVALNRNSRITFRPKNVFAPLSPHSPGFTPIERLVDRGRTVGTNPDPPWNSPRNADPYAPRRNPAYENPDRGVTRNNGDPYFRPQSESYPQRNVRHETRPHVHEGHQARRLGEILSDMSHTRYNQAHLPSRYADQANVPSRHADQAHLSSRYADQANLPSTHADQSHLPSRYADQANLPSTHADQAHLPSRYADQANLPSRYADQAHLPSRHADQANLPPRHAGQAHLPSRHADQANLPPRHAGQAPLPSRHTDQAHPPSRHADQAHLPSRHADQAPLPSRHADQAHLPSRHVDQAHLPSRHADSRPHPIRYTIPDTAISTQMRVRRVKQSQVANEQPGFVDQATERVRGHQEPSTHYQDVRSPVSSNSGSVVAIPDNYSNPARTPQASYEPRRFANERQQLHPTEVRAPSSTRAQIPSQPYQQASTGLDRNGVSSRNSTGELVVVSMQENADGTITYTMQDPRKANADRRNNVPLQVKKPTASYSNPNDYNHPRQRGSPHAHHSISPHHIQPRSGAIPPNPMDSTNQPTYSGASYNFNNDPGVRSNQTYIKEATHSSPSQHQTSHIASADPVPNSYQTASQTQTQQNVVFDPPPYETVRPHGPPPQDIQTGQYHQIHVIPKHDTRTSYNSGVATSSVNTGMNIPSVAQQSVTYVQSVTPPNSGLSVNSTEAVKPSTNPRSGGNYAIDDGVVYKVTNGNSSIPVEMIHTQFDKHNTSVPRQEPAVKPAGRNLGNPSSYGGYAFPGSGRVNPNSGRSGNTGQYAPASSPVGVARGSQPIALQFQDTTPSTQPRSNIQILKDIVKLSGRNAPPSQALAGRFNTAVSSSVTQQRPVPRPPSQGNALLQAARGITKLQALKSLECIPVTVSTNVPCQSSCLPFHNCVTAGNVLFCCPPLVTESVVQFTMMQRTVEGMSDSL